MKEWHVEHMQKTVVKYVKGLSETASAFEKRNHKKYGGLNHICRQIEYDVKHGVTEKEVISMLQKVRNHPSYSELRKGNGSMERLKEVEVHFTRPRIEFQQKPW
ncbi:hypothetical protein [Candidatus Nitrososphaera evergladensis]|nr:hypothetical protein [Candidatus Nitrososphaera evergladensis]